MVGPVWIRFMVYCVEFQTMYKVGSLVPLVEVLRF